MNVFVDNQLVTVNNNPTILQLCSNLNISVPRFCYHELLSISGNCRMCLVQVGDSLKPVVSCATNLVDNMKVYTNNSFVRRVREDILEFLLINHPLDCPICDQGGECDLQDQSLYYGSDRGRFHEAKRSVRDKSIGFFIQTVMTRCIHCTRCVRFSSEVMSVPFLGTVGRGNDMEISNYLDGVESFSLLSGNLVDICPVGAITSKPYSFVARPWELFKTESIDFIDPSSSFIRVDTRSSVILRILPRYSSLINYEWVSDKIRFCYDSIKTQRLSTPLISLYGKFVYVDWFFSFYLLKHLHLSNTLFGFFVEGFHSQYQFGSVNSDLDTSLSSKFFLNHYRGRVSVSSDFCSNSVDLSRSSYSLSSSINDLSSVRRFFLLNTSLDLFSPVLAYRLRKFAKDCGSSVTSIGSFVLGSSHKGALVCTVKHLLFNRNLSALVPSSGDYFLFDAHSDIHVDSSLSSFFKNFGSRFGFLNNYLSSYSHFDISFSAFKNDRSSSYFSFSFDSTPVDAIYSVYCGTHGVISSCDLMLPLTTPFERNSLVLNNEIRLLENKRSITPLSLSKNLSDLFKLFYLFYFNYGLSFLYDSEFSFSDYNSFIFTYSSYWDRFCVCRNISTISYSKSSFPVYNHRKFIFSNMSSYYSYSKLLKSWYRNSLSVWQLNNF